MPSCSSETTRRTPKRPRSMRSRNQQRGVGNSLLLAGHLRRQDLPEALLVHSYADQKRHGRDPRSPSDLQVGGIQLEVGVFLILQRTLAPFLLLFFKTRGDAAYGILAYPHLAQSVGDAGYLPDRDPTEVHLENRLLDVPGHALVTLEDFDDELALPVAGHRKA